MTAVSLRQPDDDAQAGRRDRILDSAERCFVRSGFHRTTMQEIANDAVMSPGNLYRYFPSKDAMVAGLAERDRAQMAHDFALLAEADDFSATFVRMVRKHFLEEPREKAVLCLAIWSEATRNPAFAELSRAFDCDVLARLTGLIGRAKDRGKVPESVEPASVALLIATLANGLFVRRAVAPGFDAEREIEQMLAVIEAAFAGRLRLPPASAAPDGCEGESRS